MVAPLGADGRAAPSDYGGEEFDAGPPAFLSARWTFLILVFIPAALAGWYYAKVATDQFVAETRMIVRTIGLSQQFDESEEREGRAVIGGDSLTQDAYIFANYLESTEIVRRLEESIGLSAMFSAKEIDWLSRLPEDAAFEQLHRFWLKQISTYVDGPSGIIILRVRAFSPEQAVTISNEAVAVAAEMIDRLSTRAERDVVVRAEAEVRASAEAYGAALVALRDFQNEAGILDPELTMATTSSVIAGMVEQKLALEVRLSSLMAAGAADSSTAAQLRELIAALDEQIRAQEETITSTRDQTDRLSQRMTEFARLETRRLTAEAIYRAAQENLDTAKSAAIRRTTFVSTFSEARLPEESRHPARFSAWVLLTAGLLCLWGTLTLVRMSVEDHRS